MNKIIWGVVIVIVLLFAVNLFKAEDSVVDTQTAISETTKVRIADLPVLNTLPFYLALEKGYFEEVGLEIERIKMSSPNLIIDALLAGNADMTSLSGAMGIAGIANLKKPNSLKIYAATGGDKIVAEDSIFIKINSTISSIAELKGKKLGILPGIQWRTIARHILAEENLEADKDVIIVELAPGLQVSALDSGQIDALLALEPMMTIAKTKGVGKELVKAAAAYAISNPFYAGAGIVRTEFAEKNPNTMAKIIAVFDRAIEEMNNNPEEVKQYLKGYTALNDDAIISQLPILKAKLYKDFDETDINAIQKFYDIFTQHGVVDGKMDFRSMIYSR